MMMMIRIRITGAVQNLSGPACTNIKLKDMIKKLCVFLSSQIKRLTALQIVYQVIVAASKNRLVTEWFARV